MLKLSHITISRQEKTILMIPEVDMFKGQHVAVLGPNGAGKSSLLKVICGEWPSHDGQVLFHDRLLTSWSRRLLAKHLGVMPQASQIDFPFSVFEVASIGATPLVLKQQELNSQVSRYLKQTDVIHLQHQLYSNLSGGEKQRVQLARVLLQLSQAEYEPLLLLDEPTSAQDLGHEHHLMSLLSDLTRQQSYGVISVLHDLNVASRYSDAVWVIDDKQLVMKGSAEQVLTPERVEKHWQYLPEKIHNLKQGFALL